MDGALLRMAYQVATQSPDESNQNGAVLVSPGGQVIQTSFNRYPRGFKPTPAQTQRPRKYNFIVHAEQGAVLGVDARDCILYCPWAACTKCAQCIVESGVTEVVTHWDRMATTPERWVDDIKDADDILNAAGVVRSEFIGPLDLKFTIRVNGEDWTC